MSPSETTAGQAWLEHFVGKEHEAAKALIDSLEIHDHAEVINGLKTHLSELLKVSPTHFPAGLIPIRSLEDLPKSINTQPVAYKTFQPGFPFSPIPGSEAEIGSLFRGLIKNSPEMFLSPELDIHELKEKKARSLFLVTDYSGSGKQAQRFAETFTQNSTIASWISLGILQIHVVSYASSLAAGQLFRNERHISFRTITTAKSASSANWSLQQREDIKSLCVKHASSSSPMEPLGYGKSFGLYLSNIRVPNNLPQILIRDGGKWPGLFPNRELPEGFYEELRSYQPHVSLTQTLRNMGASDIANKLEESNRPVRGLRALAVLHLLDHNIAEDQVFAMLKLPENNLKLLKSTLISLGLMTLKNRVTEAGKRELSYARRSGYKPSKFHHNTSTPLDYIPTQLR